MDLNSQKKKVTMSYRIYTTDAVILRKHDSGEADKVYSFFTKEFGRINVKAQSVRHLKSKLRYHLSGFSFLRISFVATSGEQWRLIDAEEISVCDGILGDGRKVGLLASLFELFLRLVPYQETDYDLWNLLESMIGFLNGHRFASDKLEDLDVVARLKIMAHLGYIDQDKLGKLKLNDVRKKREYFLDTIQEGLLHSQL